MRFRSRLADFKDSGFDRGHMVISLLLLIIASAGSIMLVLFRYCDPCNSGSPVQQFMALKRVLPPIYKVSMAAGAGCQSQGDC